MPCYLPGQEFIYRNAAGRNVELKELRLNHEKNIGYYLSAKYRVEDEHSIREVDIPKILLGVNPRFVAIRQEGDHWLRNEVDIGFGFCTLVGVDIGHGVNDTYFIETVVEEKTHEMTLDEIEKKLGYKVKIVNK